MIVLCSQFSAVNFTRWPISHQIRQFENNLSRLDFQGLHEIAKFDRSEVFLKNVIWTISDLRLTGLPARPARSDLDAISNW